MVRALAFHQCGPGSISALGIVCGLSLLVLYSAMRGFSLGTLVFPSHQKPTFDLISFVNNSCKIVIWLNINIIMSRNNKIITLSFCAIIAYCLFVILKLYFGLYPLALLPVSLLVWEFINIPFCDETHGWVVRICQNARSLHIIWGADCL